MSKWDLKIEVDASSREFSFEVGWWWVLLAALILGLVVFL